MEGSISGSSTFVDREEISYNNDNDSKITFGYSLSRTFVFGFGPKSLVIRLTKRFRISMVQI